MRGDTEVIAMVVFAIGGFIIGNYLALEHISNWLKEFTNPVATLLAAFLGAYYAFLLNEKKEFRRERKKHVQGGNRVIFGLIRIYNQFSAINGQFIRPHLSSQFRALEILPAVGSLGGFQPFDTNDVAVFIEGNNPALSSEITKLEMEASATFELIALRSRTHLEAQAKLDAAKVPNNTVLTKYQLEAIIGPALLKQLVMATDDMITSVDSIISGCADLIPQLNEDLKKIFKGHQIIGMEVRAQQGTQKSPPTGGPLA